MSKLILKGKLQNIAFWLEEDIDLNVEIVFRALKRYIDFLLEEKDNGDSEAEKTLCEYIYIRGASKFKCNIKYIEIKEVFFNYCKNNMIILDDESKPYSQIL